MALNIAKEILGVEDAPQICQGSLERQKKMTLVELENRLKLGLTKANRKVEIASQDSQAFRYSKGTVKCSEVRKKLNCK